MKKQKKKQKYIARMFQNNFLLIVILQTKTCRHNFWDLISGWVLLQQ